MPHWARGVAYDGSGGRHGRAIWPYLSNKVGSEFMVEVLAANRALQPTLKRG